MSLPAPPSENRAPGPDTSGGGAADVGFNVGGIKGAAAFHHRSRQRINSRDIRESTPGHERSTGAANRAANDDAPLG